MDFPPPRILVSVVPEAKERIKALLPECDLHFVETYADAALAVKTRRYLAAMIGVHLGRARVEELVRLIRDIQPDVRMLAIAAVDRGPLPPLPAAAEQAGVEGPFDFSRDVLPPPACDALARIHAECRAA